MAAAAQAGLTGAAPVEGEPAELPPVPVDPEVLAAEEAMAVGDYAGAAQAYDALLLRKPGEPEAIAGRAWAQLLERSVDADPEVVLAAALAAPDDVAAQTAAADVEILSEQIDEAIKRLVDVVRRTSGDDRDVARAHLLSLFDALDPADPRIVTGRRSLANALF